MPGRDEEKNSRVAFECYANTLFVYRCSALQHNNGGV